MLWWTQSVIPEQSAKVLKKDFKSSLKTCVKASRGLDRAFRSLQQGWQSLASAAGPRKTNWGIGGSYLSEDTQNALKIATEHLAVTERPPQKERPLRSGDLENISLRKSMLSPEISNSLRKSIELLAVVSTEKSRNGSFLGLVLIFYQRSGMIYNGVN